MMNIYADAASSLLKTLEAITSVQVVYTANGTDTTITAIPTVPPRSDIASAIGGLMVSNKQQDWIVRASLLAAEPVVGDTITEPTGLRWKVVADASESCFHYSDPAHKIYRIHTSLTHN